MHLRVVATCGGCILASSSHEHLETFTSISSDAGNWKFDELSSLVSLPVEERKRPSSYFCFFVFSVCAFLHHTEDDEKENKLFYIHSAYYYGNGERERVGVRERLDPPVHYSVRWCFFNRAESSTLASIFTYIRVGYPSRHLLYY